MTATLTIDQANGAITSGDTKLEPFQLFDAMGKYAHVESGFLPPGVISFRQSGGVTQVVTQIPPRVSPYRYRHGGWGDVDKGMRMLATPWRITIGTFDSTGHLCGIKMFYSPEQVRSFDDIMWWPNLPNVSATGWHGGGVGWLCPFDTTIKCATLGEMVNELHAQASGGSTYTELNMHGYTSQVMYQKMHPERTVLYKVDEWEKRSEEEGAQWMCDPDLLMMVKVESADSQAVHKKDGVPLTLAMAMAGWSKWYYNEPLTNIKPYNLTAPVADTGHQMLRVVKQFLADAAAKKVFNHKQYGLDVEAMRKAPAVPDTETDPKPAKAAAVKKVAAKKATATKKAAAKKAPAKRAAAKKKAPAKKAPAKKATA